MENETKHPGGRPEKIIDKEEFEKLCAFQCTLEEISSFFDCSEDKIEYWCEETYNKKFKDIYAIKRRKGKVSLRRVQFLKAMKGDNVMLIWLGKQYLDQREKIEQENKGEQKLVVEFIDGDKNTSDQCPETQLDSVG